MCSINCVDFLLFCRQSSGRRTVCYPLPVHGDHITRFGLLLVCCVFACTAYFAIFVDMLLSMVLFTNVNLLNLFAIVRVLLLIRDDDRQTIFLARQIFNYLF